MLVAFVDACVLYMRGSRDLLLRAARRELFLFRWTREVLEETLMHLEADYPDAEFRAYFEQLAEEFEDGLVEGYERRLADAQNDPKDRHVLAAAIEASVDFIVTENTSHFPDEACAAYGIRAIGADDFFLELFHLSPDEMIRALREQAEAWASIWDLADGLDKMESRAPQFVHAVREALGRSGDEA